MRRQCELLIINRSTLYYEASLKPEDEVSLLNEIRDIWESYPFYGYRRITKELKSRGYHINRKRVQRLELRLFAKAGHKYQVIIVVPREGKWTALILDQATQEIVSYYQNRAS